MIKSLAIDDKKLKVGLLGGSFNPAHKGHLHVARRALKALRLDQVWLVVSPQNPLKSATTGFEERFASAKTIADGKKIIASDIEKKLMKYKSRFYTYEFLKKLSVKYPEIEFVFLIGADNLLNFHKWYRWKDIVRQFKVAVFPRSNYNYKAVRSRAYISYPDRFYLARMREVGISSTELRAKNSL